MTATQKQYEDAIADIELVLKADEEHKKYIERKEMYDDIIVKIQRAIDELNVHKRCKCEAFDEETDIAIDNLLIVMSKIRLIEMRGK